MTPADRFPSQTSRTVILEAFRFSMCGGENPGPCAATPWFDDFTLAEFPKGK